MGICFCIVLDLWKKSVHRISAKDESKPWPRVKDGDIRISFDIPFLKIRSEIKVQFEFKNICFGLMIELFF